MRLRTLPVDAILFFGLVTSGGVANLVSNGDFYNLGTLFINNTGFGSGDWQFSRATAIPGCPMGPSYPPSR